MRNAIEKTNALENAIVHFFIQCANTNTNVQDISKLIRVLDQLITRCMNDPNTTYLSKLFKIIYYTRDIVCGKGNRDLAYMMIYVWSKHHLLMAKTALKSFVSLEGFAPATEKPYGSWKDLKYFCNYVMKMTNNVKEPMIQYAVKLICHQIREDYDCAVYGGGIENKRGFESEGTQISLCARWTPRETSPKFGWLFKLIASTYIPDYAITSKTRDSMERANRKTYREFSKIIVGLNRVLDTPQIKMCAKQWAAINHTKSTCLTIYKSRAAFLNYSKRRGPVLNDDRIQCAKNFANVSSHYCNEDYVIGDTMYDIVKNAIQNIEPRHVIDDQWTTFMHKYNGNNCNNGNGNNFEHMIAMIDMSASMCMEKSIPLYSALGLGIAIAEKSCLGRRILSFSMSPSWIGLEKCATFSECINTLTDNIITSKSSMHMYMALNEILYACINRKISDKTVNKMVIFIATDMELNIADENYHTEMIECISEKYRASGYSTIPHILFWNLSRGKFEMCNGSVKYGTVKVDSTQEQHIFPQIHISKMITVVTGFSDYLLSEFIKKGISAFSEMSQWTMMLSILDNPRYSFVDDFFE